jgi:hypothetical protein
VSGDCYTAICGSAEWRKVGGGVPTAPGLRSNFAGQSRNALVSPGLVAARWGHRALPTQALLLALGGLGFWLRLIKSRLDERLEVCGVAGFFHFFDRNETE